jgi:hemolysin type calcium-binding protein
MTGGAGDDLMEGADGKDSVTGDAGNDQLHGGTAPVGQKNILNGGTGTDSASCGPDARTSIEVLPAGGCPNVVGTGPAV